jgi:hypothetical protein
LAFLTQNKAKICKILLITLVFEKNANFSAENWEKSSKIVIITSTPGLATFRATFSQTHQATLRRKFISSFQQRRKQEPTFVAQPRF